ncbi:MAG: phosphonate C-P lyase system protein PhnH [Hoeflea sp.]|uniref:phosphonate C-P lyase system protein PhnH n=1 Tax=Hoeflea sp. TaxID=1940281 RepID=UPI003297A4EA
MPAATHNSTVYEGGFSDPVGASQLVFRALMEAMARPGSVHALPEMTSPPAPLTASASVLIAALAGAGTPVWLDPALTKTSVVRDWIVFHTGAPITAHQSEAVFAVVAAPQSLSALNGFSLGTQEFPDRSTSVILQVSTLSEGAQLTLEGPGIKDRASLAPEPMPQHFTEQWQANRQAFPRGIDLILAGHGCVAAMPRSTRLIRPEA